VRRVSRLTRLFFLVSGEHKDLPCGEIVAIIESEGFEYSKLEGFTQVVSLEADEACLRAVNERSSLTRVCCIELFRCRAEEETMLQSADNLPTRLLPRRGETFSVRIKRVQASSPELDVPEIERALGSVLYRNSEEPKVEFRNPSKPYFGVLSDGLFFFGLKVGEVDLSRFGARSPKRRPFFHPTALTAKLARCMVNLSRAQRGSILLDPFCGTGTILLEAGLIGCHPIGVDVKERMVRGARRNIRGYRVTERGLIVADARVLPLRGVDCVATDPPYGRSSTTMGLEAKSLLVDFLSSVPEAVKKGAFISLAAPSDIGVSAIGESFGYELVDSHQMRVHRSLTREIAVLKVR